MNRQLIWKEWRDHRAALLALWVSFPLVLIALLWSPFSDELFYADSHRLTGLMSITIALITVGFGTFSGEWRRGHGMFLARLPGGLTRSFAIKLSFLVCVLAASWLWTGGWTSALFGTTGWQGPDLGLPQGAALAMVLLPTFACILAVSASVSQPGFALIGGPVMAGLLTLPFWYVVLTGQPNLAAGVAPIWSLPHISPGVQVYFALIAAVVGPSVAIWVAYTRHKKLQGNRSALLAMGLVVMGCAPVWANWGYGHWQLNHVYPGSSHFGVTEAFVGESGRFAFVNSATRFHRHILTGQRAIRVDLESGDFEIAGVLGTKFRSPLDSAKPYRPRESFPFSHTVTRIDSFGDSKVIHFDADSGEATETPHPRRHPWPMPTPDNSALPEGARLSSNSGLGWRDRMTKDVSSYWDPTRQALIALPEGERFFPVAVLPGPWLVKIQTRSQQPQEWLQFDPETGSLTPDPYLKAEDANSSTLKDGRILFRIDDQVALYDPQSGDPPIVLKNLGNAPSEIPYLQALNAPGYRVVDQADPIILGTISPDSHHAGWLDLENLTVHWRKVTLFDENEKLMASIKPGCAMFIHDQSQLIRINFVTGERTVLFPKGEELKP